MKTLAKFCLALALTTGSAAHAVTTLDDGAAFSKVVNVDSGFSFIHTYKFHLDFLGSALIGTSVQELKLGDLIDIDWADTNAFVVKDSLSNVLYSAGESAAIGSFAFDSLPLSTRDFSITLSGEATGRLDPAGMYAISVVTSAIPTSPVPEPATKAMLLGGLGLIGFLARRRSKK